MARKDGQRGPVKLEWVDTFLTVEQYIELSAKNGRILLTLSGHVVPGDILDLEGFRLMVIGTMPKDEYLKEWVKTHGRDAIGMLLSTYVECITD